MLSRPGLLVTLLTLAAAGCSSEADDAPVASELALSQTTASTVAAPDVPPPCDAADLRWIADPATEPDTLFLIRVRNAGDIECELDVSQSEIADPTMEPDVWLEPGGLAELMVVEGSPGCTRPEIHPSVQLLANGAPVDVIVDLDDMAPWCQLAAVAIYPM